MAGRWNLWANRRASRRKPHDAVHYRAAYAATLSLVYLMVNSLKLIELDLAGAGATGRGADRRRVFHAETEILDFECAARLLHGDRACRNLGVEPDEGVNGRNQPAIQGLDSEPGGLERTLGHDRSPCRGSRGRLGWVIGWGHCDLRHTPS